MCGIIAVLRRRSRRRPPAPAALVGHAEAARDALRRALREPAPEAELAAGATGAEALAQELGGVPGLAALLADPGLQRDLAAVLQDATEATAEMEQRLDRQALDGSDVERCNALLIRIQDALWSAACDRLPAAAAVRELAGDTPGGAALEAYHDIHLALNALDRLEVRGRDSAGLSVLVSGIDANADGLGAALEARQDPLFQNRAVRRADGCLVFVYKAAAEIGELGDNGKALRAAIAGDELLQQVLAQPEAEALVVGHTRWASVGIISEPNAHPLDERTLGREGPQVHAVLNGDVDNHEELRLQHGLRLPPEITTDAKVVPALISERLAEGAEPLVAFRTAAGELQGSVAIAAATAAHPDRLYLAQRGSGQALYVGLAEDAFVVASEPYGVVEATDRCLRLDGESPAPGGSRGQVVELVAAHAGEVAGIRRQAYDGTALPISTDDLLVPGITTRDIDRGRYPHYLLKEIHQAPDSLRKTLRGRIADRDGRLSVQLGPATLPKTLLADLQAGRIRQALVCGQGTAAVAGQGIARALQSALGNAMPVAALPATELSAFGLRDDMTDTLVVAVSQSGTTTDTNRTVDLVRARGARVIAIVNRRGSDLAHRADGVLYTSDGRDVEMSVASTKAFYAQVTAGWLLALALARAAGCADDLREHDLLRGLQRLPEQMRQVLERDDAIAGAARRLAPPRRHWAVVGNGANKVAAEEVRIKLSELCYKSIACDITEDKKHIDLSSEPLILVCAAGLTGANADDTAKEIAIYRAHKAAPIVIATDGDSRYRSAEAVLEVPPAHPALAYLLAAMAGHLFGYRAALAIDALAVPLRRARGAIEEVADDPELRRDPLAALQSRLLPAYGAFRQDLMLGRYDGSLEARTASRLTTLFACALGMAPLDTFAAEFGLPASPGALIDALATELTSAIDQLTRPVDAIKHQAKTVTVGITRAEESLLDSELVTALLAAGVPREHLTYADLRSLAALTPAVSAVTGATRYAIAGDPATGQASLRVLLQTGSAEHLRSRTADDPRLKGTKHQVISDRQVLVARGRSDDRTVLLVPEVRSGVAVGITLLHVDLPDRLPSAIMAEVLAGYRNRLAALQDQVLETEPEFDRSLLEQIPVRDLLTASVQALADHWRHGSRV